MSRTEVYFVLSFGSVLFWSLCCSYLLGPWRDVSSPVRGLGVTRSRRVDFSLSERDLFDVGKGQKGDGPIPVVYQPVTSPPSKVSDSDPVKGPRPGSSKRGRKEGRKCLRCLVSDGVSVGVEVLEVMVASVNRYLNDTDVVR